MMNGTVGIMRPARYARDSLDLVTSLGFNAVVCPMIEINDNLDKGFESFTGRVFSSKADYVIFTSANGVDFTLRKIQNTEQFIENLNNSRIIAIGPNTRDALEQHGIHVSLMPEVYSSTGLIELLSDVSGCEVDIVRSTHGAPVLVEKLLERGARVHETCVYTLVKPSGEEQQEFIRQVLDGKVDILPFTSTMMVRNFMSIAESMGVSGDLLDRMNKILVGAIGIPTANTLKKYGIKNIIMPEKYLFKDLLLELKAAHK